MAFHIAPCRLLKSGGIWPSRKAVPECGTMSDISHSTAPEQELIYYPASSGIRLHVSIYNTAASKGKKKKGGYCFSFIQQFRSKLSLLEIIICNIVWSLTPDCLFLWAFLLKGNKPEESPDTYFPLVRDPMWKRQEIILQTLWIMKHLPAPHALQLWVTLVQLYKSPNDKMSAIGSCSQSEQATSPVQVGRKQFSHPTKISKINC